MPADPDLVAGSAAIAGFLGGTPAAVPDRDLVAPAGSPHPPDRGMPGVLRLDDDGPTAEAPPAVYHPQHGPAKGLASVERM